MRPTIDQAVDVALGALPIELRPLVGMDLPVYTLGCEVDGVATSSKGPSLSVAARGVLSDFGAGARASQSKIAGNDSTTGV